MRKAASSEKLNKYLPQLTFLAALVFFAYVGWTSPLTADDLYFKGNKLQSVAENAEYALHYGNGRILGNFFGSWLVNYRPLRALIKGLSFSLLTAFFPYAAGCRSKAVYPLSFVLFVCCEATLFSQVIYWTSGFQNYVPPVVMTVLIISLIRFTATKKSGALNAAAAAAIFILGSASQLYVEHSSFINVLLAAGLTVFAFGNKGGRGKKFRLNAVVWLVSAVLGAAVMLLVPKIFKPDTDLVEEYRSFAFGSFSELARSVLKNFYTMARWLAFSDVLFVFLAFAAFALLALCVRKQPGKALLPLGAADLTVTVGSILFKTISRHTESKAEGYAFSAFMLVSYLLLIVTVLVCLKKMKDRKTFGRVLLLLVFSLLSLAPLLVVSPIGARCFFMAFAFASGALLTALDRLAEISPVKVRNALPVASLCAAAAALAVYGAMAVSIGSYVFRRENYVEKQLSAGADRIAIFTIDSEYVWDSTWGYDLCYYHEKPGDVEFEIMDSFDEWRAAVNERN